eukprot:5076032-Alexandrium_andersonii.AAC.1
MPLLGPQALAPMMLLLLPLSALTATAAAARVAAGIVNGLLLHCMLLLGLLTDAAVLRLLLPSQRRGPARGQPSDAARRSGQALLLALLV